MSKARSRNSLLLSHSKVAHSLNGTDELSLMKYHLDKPIDSIYPLDSNNSNKDEVKLKHKKGRELTYPDFHPWKDHTQMDDESSRVEIDKMTNSLYLNKGLFEAPQVPNEYYTARNLIQATLFSSGENCFEVLKELSQHLAGVHKTRNEVINKIRADSNNFKLPAKVTLTTLKREAWLADLANDSVPLSKISSRIPHGLKNKVLVDVLCSNSVPIPRAIWFTKCVLYGDAVAIRKKMQNRGESDALESQWLQEWTHQVVDYMYRFSRDFSMVSTPEKKSDIMNKLNYLLKYVQTLYIECLIDKSTLLSSIVRFLKDGLNLEPHYIVQLLLESSKSEANDEEFGTHRDAEINFGQRFLALLLLQVFWIDITKLDYLCKDLSEALLLNYYFISRVPISTSKQSRIPGTLERSLSLKLKESVLGSISDSIRYMFKLNTNAFIIPNYWILIGSTLYQVILGESELMSNQEIEDIQKQLQLIQHRNESLMLNMKHSKSTKEEKPFINSHRRTSSFPAGFTPLNLPFETNVVSPEQKYEELDTLESELFINRSSDDIFRIIDYLDKLKFNEELAKLLRPSLKQKSGNTDWKLNLSVAITWCITIHREPGYSSENILMFCGFLKHRVLAAGSLKYITKIKASIENSILDTIYDLLAGQPQSINFQNLYVLINELYQLKVISISAYLRKLIASGMFFSEPGVELQLNNPSVKMHVNILQNLPVLNNKQCDSILKKWSDPQINFTHKFEHGQSVLKQEVIDKFANNTLVSCNLQNLENLEVGVKYLLVNWMTEEIKKIINSSSKLIHIRFLTVTLLYKVYSSCDNLAVFFKVLVKSVLRNDGKVIVLDMDSLYLIAKLMVRHFKLIKTISGSDTGSVGYEIFRLIMVNYKDLATREPSYLNFKSIWDFIETSFDTKSRSDINADPQLQKPATIPQFIYSKATVDSPMKLNAHTVENRKASTEYSIDEFSSDLNDLTNKSYVFMTTSEVNYAFSALKLGENNETYNGENGSKRFAIVLFDYYMKYGGRLSKEEENLLIRLLINTKHILQAQFFFPFIDCFAYFTQKQIPKFENEQEKLKFTIVAKKLIANEILEIQEVLTIITTIFSNQEMVYNYNSMLHDLVIGDNIQEEQVLTEGQILPLQISRIAFYSKQGAKTLEIIANEIKAQSMEVLSFSISYNQNLEQLFTKWIVTRSRFFMENIKVNFDDDQIISLINRVSGLNTNIHSLDDLLINSSKINEFNLPLFQILFRLILTREMIKISDIERFNQLKMFIETMIPQLRFQFSLDNSFFGELFNSLPSDFKSDVLTILSSILFSHIRLLEDKFKAECEFNGVDILPLLADFFKKFSFSSIESIETTTLVLGGLSDYLSNLLTLLDSMSTPKKQAENESIDRSLSVFIRILIIYKESIAKFILNHDQGFNFLVNLKRLLVSEYFTGCNEKLKILLYDLMLISKNLLAQELNLERGKRNDIKDVIVDTPTNNNAGTPSISGQPSNLTPNQEKSNVFLSQDLVANGQLSKFEKFAAIFDLPDIDNHDILQKYLDDTNIISAVTLQENEINASGDFHIFNNSGLYLVKSSRDSMFSNEPFNLLGEKKKVGDPPKFKISSFEILENTNPEINNGKINLSLFDAYITKQNPP
ncbi:RNA polymerase II mediator complex subunit [Yamadazyma tenuis]|uniref:Mediator of RNA polymerase II transcription subunit 12 n=1 Tax=Candida tenuis (strain ATCC 10573 / BCRC 21748 / CBS 615 / JCM 9827 / NBRC 10315 / NRRL Y-1498 / VKM Y-70) TaxID=590646 RepID=G3BA60_CANTC|nr:uncharacterized protein CANTEDRAFT_99118 [Yamadazyma tenuis ATCC 10573]EGV62020.1 hypothetical protein CANTEDRAFT_99118 [Yamadazyma tenuis ATCC 10573]WEJ93270.1 RNA polymerase II mediator complex subunit [Yamadazyma tenuis]